MSTTNPHAAAAAARRAADEAEARARRLAAEDASDAAQATRDAADPRIGQSITLADGRCGTIERRSERGYLVRFDAASASTQTGTKCWVLVDAVARLEQQAAKAGGGDAVGEIIRSYQKMSAAAAAGDIRARAAKAMIEIEAIRAGKEPEALSDAARAKILARLQTGPNEPVDPATSAVILRRLDPAAARKAEAESYHDGVRANVIRMTERIRRTGR